ncbi:MAG: hypothetical protein NT128_02010 [Proteobacteria bacterium]|nr:hypothetical protein [Pseudomonadota bacterium]
MQYKYLIIASTLSFMLSTHLCAAGSSIDKDLAERQRLQTNLDSGRFDIASVNRAAMIAAGEPNQLALDVFFGQPYGKLRPNQQGIRAALYVMVCLDRAEQIKWLLNQTDAEMRPDQIAITGAYRVAIEKSQLNAIAALEPFVPWEKRQRLARLRAALKKYGACS